jgi:hypothetical protein
MLSLGVCKVCHSNRATQRHHVFPQHQAHRHAYGKLLDESFNILPVCADCHCSHAKMAGFKMSEEQFRLKAIKLGYELHSHTKSYKGMI